MSTTIDTSSSSTSASQLLSSLIPNAIIFAVFLLLFIVLRKRQRRVYEPRYTVDTVPQDLKPTESPTGAFAWITNVLSKPQTYVVQQSGPDGYFFLRFLFEFAFICLVGCIVTWPILFSVNASNSNHNKQLDILSIGNVKEKNRYFAHIFVSWAFFGLVIFIIYRELVYYTTFRHALQTTPLYDSLLSSRTLLLTEIPEVAMDESELRTFFPTAVNVWYARDYKKLEKLVKERTKLAKKYEGAVNSVLTKAIKLRNKCEKKGKPFPEPSDDINRYLKNGKKRPTHRLKFLIGKKVDTLEYGAKRLGELNEEIKAEQAECKTYEQRPAVFIEFQTQLELQKAYQAIPYSKELKKCGRRTGIAPDDVIWENLSLTPTKRRIKRVLANTFLTLTIIFWCIPIAVVGAISNINFITSKLTFLKFINNMPSVIMGVITSLLPTVLLAVLMSLVPPFIKKMGKISGCLSVQEVERYCQNWYFAFQAVNSFLVLTLASAAVSSITSIIDDPTSALKLLATKLPKASNFYISYLCLYGLSVSSGLVLQIGNLIKSHIMGRIFDKTPRAKWTRYNTLDQPSFSVLYPGFMLVSLIALAYAIIAPLILGFATITFFLIFIAFAYNFTYVLQPNGADARGRNYALALFELFTALYLAESTLVAMFVFGKNWACVALEGFWILVTAVCHVYLKWKFLPLLETVPISAIKYASNDRTFQYPMYDQGWKEIKTEGKNYWEGGNQLGLVDSNLADSKSDQAHPDAKDSELEVKGEETDSNPRVGVNNNNTEASGTKMLNKPSVGAITRFFKPKENTFDMVRDSMPASYFNYIEYNPEFVSVSYEDPVVTDDEPHIWIAKDNLGLSEIQKNKTLENGVACTDDDAGFNKKGQTEYYGPPPSYEEALRV